MEQAQTFVPQPVQLVSRDSGKVKRTGKQKAMQNEWRLLVPREWNDLPSDITNTPSLRTVKSRLARYILSTKVLII